MIAYISYMVLLTIVLVLWLVVAFRGDGAGKGRTGS